MNENVIHTKIGKSMLMDGVFKGKVAVTDTLFAKGALASSSMNLQQIISKNGTTLRRLQRSKAPVDNMAYAEKFHNTLERLRKKLADKSTN